MLASIVIPSRGGAKRLPILLAALKAQEDAEWEAIVVLDGDIDDSQSVLEADGDPRVRSIVFPENRGRVAALNAGFGDAKGGILIRCDDDLLPPPSWLTSRKNAHQRQAAGIIGLCIDVLPDTPYAHAYGLATNAKALEAAYVSPTPWRHWGANVSVSRAVWQQVGPYDPDYRAYGWEDVDYGFRVFQAGFPVVIDPALEVQHLAGATTTVSRVDRAFHSGAARRTFEAKHGTRPLGTPTSGSGLWGALVTATVKTHHSRERMLRTARTVDLAAGGLPKSVARKLIALLVESAAIAGYMDPTGITTRI